MLPEKLESALAQIELHSGEVAFALGSAEPVALERAASKLRDGVVSLAQMANHPALRDLGDAKLKRRLKHLAITLAAQREGLIRQMAVVERSLGVLMPAATQAATYDKSTSPYGARGRQTEVFKVLRA